MPFQLPLHIRDSNHTSSIKRLSIVIAVRQNWVPELKACFLRSFIQRRREMAHSSASQGFQLRNSHIVFSLQLNPVPPILLERT